MKILYILKWVLFICAIALFVAFAALFPDGVNDDQPTYIGLFLGGLFALLFAGILYCITASSRGIPANHISDERLVTPLNIVERDGKPVVDIVEVESGVWEIKKRGYRQGQLLDMGRWLRQKAYIARLLKISIVLESYNKNRQKAYSLPYGTQKCAEQCLYFNIIDLKGKSKCIKVVDSYKIKKGFCLRIIFRFSLRSDRTSLHNVNNRIIK